MKKLSGTTSIGFKFPDGVMLGSESRITNSYKDEKGKPVHEIKSDEEEKTFELSSKPRIFCTLMGDVEEWHTMYRHLVALAPKSVQAAFNIAKNYLNAFRASHRRSERGQKRFGTIIGGYQETEGFELLCVSLYNGRVVTNTEKVKVIGSGGAFASKELLQGTSDITKDEAANSVFKGLLKASFGDIFSGGYFTATFVHRHGCLRQTYHLLDVYNTIYDQIDDLEKMTLLLLYSTNGGPIFGDEDVHSLTTEIWSGGLKNIVLSNLIAKKKCFFVHRIQLQTEDAATRAYMEISTSNGRSHYPQALVHIREYLTDCIRKETRDHIYVGRSSKELLEGLCKLENAVNLKYQ